MSEKRANRRRIPEIYGLSGGLREHDVTLPSSQRHAVSKNPRPSEAERGHREGEQKANQGTENKKG